MCFRKPKVSVDTVMPKSEVSIDANELKALLGEILGIEAHVCGGDKLLCAWDDIALFVAESQADKLEYADGYKCGHFAFRLKGEFSVPGWSKLAVGIIWSEDHAFNFFVDEERAVYFIEPQTDEIKEKMDGMAQLVIV